MNLGGPYTARLMYPPPTPLEGPLSGSIETLPPPPDFDGDERLISIVSKLSLLVLEN